MPANISQYALGDFLRRIGNHPKNKASIAVDANVGKALRLLVNVLSTEMLRVVVPAPVIMDGENVQNVAAGNPVQVKDRSSETHWKLRS